MKVAVPSSTIMKLSVAQLIFAAFWYFWYCGISKNFIGPVYELTVTLTDCALAEIREAAQNARIKGRAPTLAVILLEDGGGRFDDS